MPPKTWLNDLRIGDVIYSRELIDGGARRAYGPWKVVAPPTQFMSLWSIEDLGNDRKLEHCNEEQMLHWFYLPGWEDRGKCTCGNPGGGTHQKWCGRILNT